MKTSKSHSTPSNPSSPAIAPGEIARRAHALWLARGSPAGSAMDDWFEAERQLARERNAGAPSRRDAGGSGDPIDEDKLQRRLDDFGEPAPRSYTSID